MSALHSTPFACHHLHLPKADPGWLKPPSQVVAHVPVPLSQQVDIQTQIQCVKTVNPRFLQRTRHKKEVLSLLSTDFPSGTGGWYLTHISWA